MADVRATTQDIARFAFKFLDEMISRRISIRFLPGWTASSMAAFAVYKAREEIIERRRGRQVAVGDVWPDEI